MFIKIIIKTLSKMFLKKELGSNLFCVHVVGAGVWFVLYQRSYIKHEVAACLKAKKC